MSRYLIACANCGLYAHIHQVAGEPDQFAAYCDACGFLTPVPRFSRWRIVNDVSTFQQNSANARASKNNVLGVKGVYPNHGKIRAAIHKDGKRFNLGTFETVEEASDAYLAAATRHFGAFARRGASEDVGAVSDD